MAEARGQATTVLEVLGVQWATEKNVAEAVLSRRSGVLAVEANPVAQTATVTYDRTKPRWPSWPAGCATAATTAPASRCPTTSVIRWPSRLPTLSMITDRRTAILDTIIRPRQRTLTGRPTRITPTMRPRQQLPPLRRLIMLATPLLGH